jgi:hypothetical protein
MRRILSGFGASAERTMAEEAKTKRVRVRSFFMSEGLPRMTRSPL